MILMMSLFFSLLPSDLHIDIFSTWLDAADSGYSLVRILSAVDVACSNAQDQPAFRDVIRQLPPFGQHMHQGESSKRVKHVDSYLQWLSSRNVPLKSLDLADTLSLELLGSPLLASMESIACSNITAVKSDSALPHGSLRELKRLTITASFNFSLVNECLAVIGPRLQALHMKHYVLSASRSHFLAVLCPLLQVLEVAAHPDKGLAILVERCAHIQHVELHGWLPSTTVERVLAFPQIKWFALHNPHMDDERFVRIVKARPDIAHLHLGEYKYSDAEGLCIPRQNLAVLRSILEVRPTIDKLAFLKHAVYDFVQSRLVEFIANRLGGCLKSLTITVVESRQLILLLAKCPQLRSFHLTCDQHSCTCDVMQVLVSTCTLLESLTLVVKSGTPIQADTLRMLLQVILDHRRCLKQLELCDTAFQHADVVWFRDQAKELQLLPVADVSLRAL